MADAEEFLVLFGEGWGVWLAVQGEGGREEGCVCGTYDLVIDPVFIFHEPFTELVAFG